MVQEKSMTISFKVSKEEADALIKITEKNNVSVSKFIRDSLSDKYAITKQIASLIKGILYMKKFFEKHGDVIHALDEELDKLDEIIALAEELKEVYKL